MAAFRRMADSRQFQAWARRVASELVTGKTIDQRVDEVMTPEHIKVEVKDEKGLWRIAGKTDQL